MTTSSWINPITSSLVYATALLLLLYVMRRVSGDLIDVAEALVGIWGARLITLYFIIDFYGDSVLLLRQFSENTLLTAIPALDITMICTWYALISASVAYIGIEPIARAVSLVIPFLLAGMILLIGLLYSRFNIYNLAPWLGVDFSTLLLTGLKGTTLYHQIFMLPLLATSLQSWQTVRTSALFGIGITAVIRVIILFVYTGIFGVAVGKEKTLPFFELSKLLYASRFIQRVESFFIIFWALFGIVAISVSLYMSAYLIMRLFRLPALRPLLLPLALIAVQLSLLPPDIIAVIELQTQQAPEFLLIGVYIIPTLLLSAMLLRGKGKIRAL